LATIAQRDASKNTIKHGAQADPTRHVSLELFADPGVIRATVNHPGQWDGRPGPWQHSDAGGLNLIQGISDYTDIARSPRGNRVTMHHLAALTRHPRCRA
jgi:anti-sigma regulatory factor (Ser/Thr protein kinase)